MTDLGQGLQPPGVREFTLDNPMCEVINDASTFTGGLAHDVKDNNAKEVYNGDEAFGIDQELRMSDARHWNPKYKLFVSFSAILSYFVL